MEAEVGVMPQEKEGALEKLEIQGHGILPQRLWKDHDSASHLRRPPPELYDNKFGVYATQLVVVSYSSNGSQRGERDYECGCVSPFLYSIESYSSRLMIKVMSASICDLWSGAIFTEPECSKGQWKADQA